MDSSKPEETSQWPRRLTTQRPHRRGQDHRAREQLNAAKAAIGVPRSSAGTIATLFGLLFVPTILVSVLPHSAQATIAPYLPMNAGEQIFIATHHEANTLGPWTGFGVFSLYAAIAIVIGFATITRRDA